jgi:hypothetical protein
MIGETPTTGARVPRSASRTPGTPRMVPIETTGLLGGSRTTSAVRIASRTPGAGRAVSMPSARIRRAGTAACSRTHHSWKWIARKPSASSISTCVSTRSSLMGSSRTPSSGNSQRSHSRAVTSVSVNPWPSSRVRTTWVARSRSPRVNQSGPSPYAANSSATVNRSSARPQPCPSWIPPPRVYMTVSRSGQTRSPCRVMSSAVFPTTVSSASMPAERTWWRRPRRNRAPPTPPASAVMRMPGILSAGTRPASGGVRDGRRGSRSIALRAG